MPHFLTSSSLAWNIWSPERRAALETPGSGSTMSALTYLSMAVRLEGSMMRGMVLREFLLKAECLWWMSLRREEVTM